MTHTITLIPGDGIGPEVTEAVVRILKATGVSIDWETHMAGVVAADDQHRARVRAAVLVLVRVAPHRYSNALTAASR